MREILSAFIFIASLIYAAAIESIGFDHTILGAHQYRQTHTALPAYAMLHGGPARAFDISINGPPWAAPLEFPLLQGLVAVTCWAFRTPLDQTGRLWSLFFFFAAALPAFWLLREANLSRAQRLFVLALYFTNPFYLFWSRAFLVESAALFLSLVYLAAVARWLRNADQRWWSTAIVAGCAAGLQKVTVFSAFSLVAFLWIASRRDRRVAAWTLIAGPIVATMAWSVFAHRLRSANPIDAFEFPLYWLFGTISQKLSPATYSTVLSRTFFEFFGALGWAAAGVALLCALGTKNRSVLALLALFAMEIAIFTNLHFVHEYYQYENGVFLIAAVAISLIAISRWHRVGLPLAGLLTACVLLGQYNEFFHWFYIGIAKEPVLSRPRTWDSTLAMAIAIKERTPKDGVIVIYGFEGNPALTYYGERRTLMIPQWLKPQHHSIEAAFANLAGYAVGGVVDCGDDPGDRADALQAVLKYDFNPTPSYANDRCRLYAERRRL